MLADATAAAAVTFLLTACADRVDKSARLLESDSWCDRSKAVKALGDSGDERAIEHLVRALEDPNWRVRRQAVRSLASFKAKGVTDRLIEGLADDAWQVRREAVWALSGAADPRVPETLILALRDRNRRVRSEVARALARTGQRDAVDALADALADWHAGQAIASALEGLGWRPDSDEQQVHLWVATQQGEALRANWRLAKAVLLEDISSDNSLKVENALKALICIGNTEVLGELVDALTRTDSRSLAETFAYSRQSRLREAAIRWAGDRNLKLARRSAVRPAVWASWDVPASRPRP
ncbi:MAG: HEAT repeat domain-containing protein [candidate division WOR-3 bacterium]|nr:MAG: HEAT repeat domain-containing protein [candidate division WOR-3 bacterium]